MQENSETTEKKLLLTRITDTIINKLDDFFKLQIEKKIIKNLNSKAIALMCYSIIFHSLILWQIYEDSSEIGPDYYADEFLDILVHGIEA